MEFLLGQRLGFSVLKYCQIIDMEFCFTQSCFALDYKLTSAQQCFDPPDHFVDIDGFDHVIIRSGAKALLLVGGAFPGSNDEHWGLIFGAAQGGDKFKSIHSGHHHIGDDQIDMGVVQNIKGIQPILCWEGCIAMIRKYGAE